MIYTAPDFLRRQWTTDVNTAARRLTISRRWFGLRPKTMVDCSFDQCEALGVIEYNTEGRLTHGVYVQLQNGKRHAIPIAGSSYEEASTVASEVSRATGISRRDTSYP
jgi:hypothetical protein